MFSYHHLGELPLAIMTRSVVVVVGVVALIHSGRYVLAGCLLNDMTLFKVDPTAGNFGRPKREARAY